MSLFKNTLILTIALLSHYWANALPTSSVDLEEEDPELTGGYFEGDMDIDLTRNGVINITRRWPNNTVYYQIDTVFGKLTIFCKYK